MLFFIKKLQLKIVGVGLELYNYIHSRGRQKVFCIGRNKTGTTSLKKAFEDLGYPVGSQIRAERLAHRFYFKKDFRPIVKYCKSAQVFQDIPFSWPETYQHLDKAFPSSKFILTVRDDPEQWYSSITRFHAKNFGLDGRTPTADDLLNAAYVSKGFMYNTLKIHGTSDDDPYNKEVMTAHYERYNQEVVEYFKDRPGDLLIINIAEPGSYQRFIDFIGAKSPCDDFPWENRT